MSDVQFQFNPQAMGVIAQYGGGGGGFQPGKYMVVITSASREPTAANDGSKVVLELTSIDGPNKGATHRDNLNLENKSQKATEIAYRQLAAYLAVTGTPGIQQAFSEMFNKPFGIEVGYQSGHEPGAVGSKGYTEIKELFFANGQPLGKPGQQQQQGQPMGGGQPGPAAFGGGQAPQPQGGGFGGTGQPAAGFGQPQGQPGGFAGQPAGPAFGQPNGGGAPGFGGAPQGGFGQQPQQPAGFGGGTPGGAFPGQAPGGGFGQPQGGGFGGPAPFGPR